MSSLNGLVNLPMFAAGFGVQTPYGILLPPGGRVAGYVRSGGAQGLDDPVVAQNLNTTLNAALAKCRSGLGDTVFVLPDHAENISAADQMSNLKAGTRIIGLGNGGLMPSFRWTGTAATFLLDVAGVVLQGLRLRMEGANGVVAPITASAADCAIMGCDIEVASGASALATTALTIAAGADRFKFFGNKVRGTINAVTDVISVTGAVGDLEIVGNDMYAATAATGKGLIRVSAAALRMNIAYNDIINAIASSENGIVFGNVACTGKCHHNTIGVLTGTPATGGITFGGAALVHCFENYTTDTVNTSGLLSPAVVT